MRLPDTPAVAWHSYEKENDLELSAAPVKGSHSGYTRVEAPILERGVNVLLAVNHFSYSAAIWLSRDVVCVGAWYKWRKLRDVNGAQGFAALV
jgi:hypothetical protein